MKKIVLFIVSLGMVGCMTMSGNYTITAHDADGNVLTKNMVLTAQGSRIYTTRNALCSLHPNATVTIKDSHTGEELKSDSPYQCPNTRSKKTAASSSIGSDISPSNNTQLTSKISNLSAISDKRNQQSYEVIEDDPKSNNNGTSKSRLRLFGQNGANVILYRNTKCVRGHLGRDDERVSGGFSGAFSSFLGTVSNVSIGIPETETTRNLKGKDGLLSKVYFREYELEGNKPVTIVMGFQDVPHLHSMNGINYSTANASCKRAMRFTPKPGRDYEASFDWHEGNHCDVGMNQILQKNGMTTLKPVDVLAVAFACDN